MTDSDLVDAPLTRAEAELTPGWQHLFVVDLSTMRILDDVTKVDTEAGLVWRWVDGLRRASDWNGRYKLMCSKDTLEKFREVWKAWK